MRRDSLKVRGDVMRAWGATDQGKARTDNQDVYYFSFDDDMALCVVCDGIGGARAGKVASKVACDTAVDEIKRRRKPGQKATSCKKHISEALEIANQVVYRMSQTNDNYNGMGTTMVGALICGGETLIFNIGDSRAYLLSSSKLKRITRDHSTVEDMVEQGNITAEEARSHPNRHLITRALGTDDSVECDFYPLRANKGEWLLFCSDGLNDMLEDHEIEEIMNKDADMSGCYKRLIDEANARGGLDNITVVIVAL